MTWGVLLDPVRLDLQMPEMADPHPCLSTLSRMAELGGRVEIGTTDREGINYPEYFARGYYVNEGWLVWHWECCCSSGGEQGGSALRGDQVGHDLPGSTVALHPRRPAAAHGPVRPVAVSESQSRDALDAARADGVSAAAGHFTGPRSAEGRDGDECAVVGAVQRATLEPDGEIHINL